MTNGLNLPEKDLVSLLQKKDYNAFSYLYDQYAPLVYGLIFKEVKNEQLASEILTQTFINISNECESLSCVRQRLFSWILGMAKKTAMNGFKVNIDVIALLPPDNQLESYSQKNLASKSAYNPSFS